MKKIFILTIICFVLLVGVQIKACELEDHTTLVEPQNQQELVVEHLRDAPEEYQLQGTDKSEQVFKKIEKALAHANPGEMFRIPFIMYPEKQWFEISRLLKNAGYEVILYCETDRNKRNPECLPEKIYVLVRHK